MQLSTALSLLTIFIIHIVLSFVFNVSSHSIIREVKGIGGLDSVGIEVGDAIETRVRLELGSVVGLPRAQELMVDSIFVNDADQQWWTPIHSFEPGHEQQVRVKEFLTFVRYCPAELPIFVGHSLFFKAFYSKRISKLLDKNRSAALLRCSRKRIFDHLSVVSYP